MIPDLERATEPEEIVAALEAVGVGAAASASIAGPHAGARRSEAWDIDRLLELKSLVLLLAETLTANGIEQWLRSPNRILEGRRPLDVAADGDLARVREAAASFVGGAYL